MKCPSCGADNPPQAVACGYCNSQLPATSDANREVVFARVRSSAEFAGKDAPERHARLPKYSGFQKAFVIVFFALFISMSGGMCVFGLFFAGAFGFIGSQAGGAFGTALGVLPILLLLVVSAGFVAFGVFLWRTIHQKMNAIEQSPVEALPVIVIDKRTHVSGGSGDSSATTSYFATCEREDGSREEYQLWDGKLYGRLSAEDAGILYTRAGYGLDFDRVRV
jgi:hypothetical protein